MEHYSANHEFFTQRYETNTSSDEFIANKRIHINNEMPPIDLYDMVHSKLQNKLWEWFLGSSFITYDEIIYNLGFKESYIDENDNEIVKINDSTNGQERFNSQGELLVPSIAKYVNGVRAKDYGPIPYYNYHKNVKDNYGFNRKLITPAYHRIELRGSFLPEVDFMLHEGYRYLDVLYPNHPDFIELLTNNEINDEMTNAAEMVNYDLDCAFMDWLAENLMNDVPEEYGLAAKRQEAFKLKYRNLVNNAFRRKFYGSESGYNQFGADIMQHVTISPVAEYITIKPRDCNDCNIHGKDLKWYNELFDCPEYENYDVNQFDYIYKKPFRLMDFNPVKENKEEIAAISYSVLAMPFSANTLFEVSLDYTVGDVSTMADVFNAGQKITIDNKSATITGVGKVNSFNFDKDGNKTVSKNAVHYITIDRDIPPNYLIFEHFSIDEIENSISNFEDLLIGKAPTPLQVTLNPYCSDRLYLDPATTISCYTGNPIIKTHDVLRYKNRLLAVSNFNEGTMSFNIIKSIDLQQSKLSTLKDVIDVDIGCAIIMGNAKYSFVGPDYNGYYKIGGCTIEIQYIKDKGSYDVNYKFKPGTECTSEYFDGFIKEYDIGSLSVIEYNNDNAEYFIEYGEDITYINCIETNFSKILNDLKNEFTVGHTIFNTAEKKYELEILGVCTAGSDVINFTDEASQIKMTALVPGNQIIGKSIENDTFIEEVNINRNYIKINRPLIISGILNLTYLCNINIFKETEIDFFEHTNDEYNVFFQDMISNDFIYGVKDISEFQNSLVRRLDKYEEFLEGFNNIILDIHESDGNTFITPSVINCDGQLFMEVNAYHTFKETDEYQKELLHNNLTLNDNREYIMKVEVLDYIQKYMHEISKASDVVNIGVNINAKISTSGNVSDKFLDYTDTAIDLKFVTYDWKYDSVPHYVEIGTGMLEDIFIKKKKEINNDPERKALYNYALYDDAKMGEEENYKRALWANQDFDKDDEYAYPEIYSVDKPQFKSYLGEYEINKNMKVEGLNNYFTTVQFSIKKQELSNISKENDLLLINHDSFYDYEIFKQPSESYLKRDDEDLMIDIVYLGVWNPDDEEPPVPENNNKLYYYSIITEGKRIENDIIQCKPGNILLYDGSSWVYKRLVYSGLYGDTSTVSTFINEKFEIALIEEYDKEETFEENLKDRVKSDNISWFIYIGFDGSLNIPNLKRGDIIALIPYNGNYIMTTLNENKFLFMIEMTNELQLNHEYYIPAGRYTFNKDVTLDNTFIIEKSKKYYNFIDIKYNNLLKGTVDANITLYPDYQVEVHPYNEDNTVDKNTIITINITKDLIYFDEDNNVLYTYFNNKKYAIKQEDNKYFKNLLFIYGHYENKEEIIDNKSVTIPLLSSVKGINSNFDNLSYIDRILRVDKVNFRNIYNSNLESTSFSQYCTINSILNIEIRDNTLYPYLSYKNDKEPYVTVNRLNYINELNKIKPVNFNDDELLFENNLVPKITSIEIYKQLTQETKFIYYKNLLVLEGSISSDEPSKIYFGAGIADALSKLNQGDSIPALINATTNAADVEYQEVILPESLNNINNIDYKNETLLITTDDGKIVEIDVQSLGSLGNSPNSDVSESSDSSDTSDGSSSNIENNVKQLQDVTTISSIGWEEQNGRWILATDIGFVTTDGEEIYTSDKLEPLNEKVIVDGQEYKSDDLSICETESDPPITIQDFEFTKDTNNLYTFKDGNNVINMNNKVIKFILTKNQEDESILEGSLLFNFGNSTNYKKYNKESNSWQATDKISFNPYYEDLSVVIYCCAGTTLPKPINTNAVSYAFLGNSLNTASLTMKIDSTTTTSEVFELKEIEIIELRDYIDYLIEPFKTDGNKFAVSNINDDIVLLSGQHSFFYTKTKLSNNTVGDRFWKYAQLPSSKNVTKNVLLGMNKNDAYNLVNGFYTSILDMLEADDMPEESVLNVFLDKIKEYEIKSPKETGYNVPNYEIVGDILHLKDGVKSGTSNYIDYLTEYAILLGAGRFDFVMDENLIEEVKLTDTHLVLKTNTEDIITFNLGKSYSRSDIENNQNWKVSNLASEYTYPDSDATGFMTRKIYYESPDSGPIFSETVDNWSILRHKKDFTATCYYVHNNIQICGGYILAGDEIHKIIDDYVFQGDEDAEEIVEEYWDNIKETLALYPHQITIDKTTDTSLDEEGALVVDEKGTMPIDTSTLPYVYPIKEVEFPVIYFSMDNGESFTRAAIRSDNDVGNPLYPALKPMNEYDDDSTGVTCGSIYRSGDKIYVTVETMEGEKVGEVTFSIDEKESTSLISIDNGSAVNSSTGNSTSTDDTIDDDDNDTSSSTENNQENMATTSTTNGTENTPPCDNGTSMDVNGTNVIITENDGQKVMLIEVQKDPTIASNTAIEEIGDDYIKLNLPDVNETATESNEADGDEVITKRVLVSVDPTEPIEDTYKYLTYRQEYINSKGEFKVPIIKEVDDETQANRVYSPKEIGDVNYGVPTLAEDVNHEIYQYDEIITSNGIKYQYKELTNNFGQTIKLCKKNGDFIIKLNDASNNNFYNIKTLIEEKFSPSVFVPAPIMSEDYVPSIDMTPANVTKLIKLDSENAILEITSDIDLAYLKENDLLYKFDQHQLESVIDSDTDEVFAELLKDHPYVERWGTEIETTSTIELYDGQYASYNNKLLLKDTNIKLNLSMPYNYNEGQIIYNNIVWEIENNILQNVDENKPISGVYLKPKGYGSSSTEYLFDNTRPELIDEDAFEKCLTKNTANEFVYLVDKDGNRINSTNGLFEVNEKVNFNYDDLTKVKNDIYVYKDDEDYKNDNYQKYSVWKLPESVIEIHTPYDEVPKNYEMPVTFSKGGLDYECAPIINGIPLSIAASITQIKVINDNFTITVGDVTKIIRVNSNSTLGNEFEKDFVKIYYNNGELISKNINFDEIDYNADIRNVDLRLIYFRNWRTENEEPLTAELYSYDLSCGIFGEDDSRIISTEFEGIHTLEVKISIVDTPAIINECECYVNKTHPTSSIEFAGIISGLYGNIIFNVPKYKNYKDLIENVGYVIESENNIFEGDLTIKNISNDNIQLSDQLEDDQYLRIKILPENTIYPDIKYLNNDDYIQEVSLNDIDIFGYDRVYINENGYKLPPIIINNKMYYEDSLEYYYENSWLNKDNFRIFLCDIDGKAVKYDIYDDYLDFITLGDNNGDCSEDIHGEVDPRINPRKPKYLTSLDLYKSQFYIKGKEINPFVINLNIKDVYNVQLNDFEQQVKITRQRKYGNIFINDTVNNSFITQIDNSIVYEYDKLSNELKQKNKTDFLDYTNGNINILLKGPDESLKLEEDILFYGIRYKNPFYSTGVYADYWENNRFNIENDISLSFTINSTENVLDPNDKNYGLLNITEMGLFNKEGLLIAYMTHPIVQYRSDINHISYTLIIQETTGGGN